MIEFKKASYSDAKAITTLVNSAYRGESSKQGWTTEEHLLGGQRTDKRKIKEMIRDHHVELILDEKAQILGCVYLEVQGPCLYLGMLTVSPRHQAQGLGKSLLTQAETYARTRGLKKIRMTVIDSRLELIAFYERRGYRLTGNTEAFPMNDPRFGLPKVTDLRFKELERELV